ncbi:MAG: DUF1080 domain-containing protein [Cyclobacteriaceae bacterium]|nr:DUF1080 domain-containing protein [Cyclobacteriaceae bacterium]
MKNLSFLPFLVLLSFIFQSCQKPSDEISTEFESLFNGENLEGWYIQGDAQANVENGMLNLSNDQSGPGGWLLSNGEYKNFHLEFEFLCPPPNNSGVAVRYKDSHGGHPAVSAYEINIFSTPNTQNPTGSVYNLARSFLSDSLKPMDWNRMEIIARGDCLVTKVNGVQLLTTHQRRAFAGHIGFQAHDGKVKHAIQLKNIRIKPLPHEEISSPQIEDYMRSTMNVKSELLLASGDLSNWEIVGDGQWELKDDHILGRTRKDDFSFLKSVKAYRDFYLTLKFRIKKSHNSGVFILQDPLAAEISLATGLEINIYDHDGFAYGWPTGSVVTKARAFIGIVDYDDWNTMEIFSFQNHICTYVNGLKASEYYVTEEFDRPGNICLQVGVQVASEEKGGSEVGFKDVEIKDFSEIPFIGY